MDEKKKLKNDLLNKVNDVIKEAVGKIELPNGINAIAGAVFAVVDDGEFHTTAQGGFINGVPGEIALLKTVAVKGHALEVGNNNQAAIGAGLAAASAKASDPATAKKMIIFGALAGLKDNPLESIIGKLRSEVSKDKPKTVHDCKNCDKCESCPDPYATEYRGLRDAQGGKRNGS